MVGREISNDERMRGPSLSLMLIAAQGAAEGAPRGGQSSAHVPSRGFFSSRISRTWTHLKLALCPAAYRAAGSYTASRKKRPGRTGMRPARWRNKPASKRSTWWRTAGARISTTNFEDSIFVFSIHAPCLFVCSGLYVALCFCRVVSH